MRELGDEALKKIAVGLTQKLRVSVTVDWSVRENVRARLRVMAKTLLKRYKYPLPSGCSYGDCVEAGGNAFQ